MMALDRQALVPHAVLLFHFRIGDTFITYLLEHTSLYISVTTDCLVQLTGMLETFLKLHSDSQP